MAECEKAYAATDASNATEMIEGRRGSSSRLGLLYRNTIQIEHEYAQMAVHMRFNGLVPPSSKGRRAKRQGRPSALAGSLGA